jgi:hypothetical protein
MDDRQQTRRFWGLIAFAALALLGFLSGSFVMLGIGALGLLFVVLALPGASSGLSAPRKEEPLHTAGREDRCGRAPTVTYRRRAYPPPRNGPAYERTTIRKVRSRCSGGGWDTGPPS